MYVPYHMYRYIRCTVLRGYHIFKLVNQVLGRQQVPTEKGVVKRSFQGANKTDIFSSYYWNEVANCLEIGTKCIVTLFCFIIFRLWRCQDCQIA